MPYYPKPQWGLPRGAEVVVAQILLNRGFQKRSKFDAESVKLQGYEGKTL